MAEKNGKRIITPGNSRHRFATREDVVRATVNASKEVYELIAKEHGQAFTVLEESVEKTIADKLAPILARLEALEREVDPVKKLLQNAEGAQDATPPV